MTSDTPAISLAKLTEKTSGRRSIPLRKGFVRSSEGGGEPPLHKLYSGGRSGTVAVKLYLALVWKAVAEPYDVSGVPASTWAALLDLDDPMGKGRKRIYTALSKLVELKLIKVKTRPGYPPQVFLLSELGDGSAYVPPSDAVFADSRRGRSAQPENLYFKVPSRLWTTGKIQKMSGPALVMYLVLAAEQGYKKEVWFSSGSFGERYFFGPKLRAQGTRELRDPAVDLEILKTRRVPVSQWGEEDFSFEVRRSRKMYKLVGDACPER